MSGVYNQTYFNNRPEEKEREGVLYGVILVNQRTFERECIKVGIASGKDWRHVIKRSRGFKGLIYASSEPITTPFIGAGKSSRHFTRSLNTIAIPQLRNLVGIQSALKFLLLFYPSSRKIILDKWFAVCYNIIIF